MSQGNSQERVDSGSRVAAVIAGSRTMAIDLISDTEVVERVEVALGEVTDPACVTEIVSGRAEGGDEAGELYAAERGLSVTMFPVNDYTDEYGRAAPLYRNDLMAQYGNVLVAFWNGRSSGTRAMISYARTRMGDHRIHIEPIGEGPVPPLQAIEPDTFDETRSQDDG